MSAPQPEMAPRFEGSFTQQEAIPEPAIQQALSVLQSGRLHRYNVADGEQSQVSALEAEFAGYMGVKYCLALASGGYAMQTALRAFGIQRDEPVLTNAFTLSPVPGAIAAVGGAPVLVECSRDLVMDLEDFGCKAEESKARLLLLSHMRGHIVDMDRLMAQATVLGVTVIEDCAHTMGARWNGTRSGAHGVAACFSTQTYKHINSGEGGFLTTDDPHLAARSTILSGSYMLYERHGAVPPAEFFRDIRLDTPNCSGRMDNLRAAILRPQLESLDGSVERWNERYRTLERGLSGSPGLHLPKRPAQEHYVGSSIQFLVEDLEADAIEAFLARCLQRGVELKWFGAPEPVAFTSRHDSWRYVQPHSLPRSDGILAKLCDMRVPLTFSVEDCALIATIIKGCLSEIRSAQ